MNESTIAGKLEQITGKVKQSIGEATGDQAMANSGAAEQVKGNVKEGWGDVKDAAGTATASSDRDAAVTKNHVQSNASEESHATRDSITSKAEQVKDSLENKLDRFNEQHK